MPRITGGCLCGSVRYETDAEPIMPGICHCSHCQKQSGSAFSLLFAVPEDSLRVSGDTLKVYEDSSETGLPVYRKFCSNCGSPVITEAGMAPGVLFIKAGTLDDMSWIEPQAEFWTDHKNPWLHFAPDLPGAPKNPE